MASQDLGKLYRYGLLTRTTEGMNDGSFSFPGA